MPSVSESAKLIAYGDDALQDVVTGVEKANPVNAYLNVETPVGTMSLKKDLGRRSRGRHPVYHYWK